MKYTELMIRQDLPGGCWNDDDDAEEFVLGRMSSEDRKLIEAHLLYCEQCRMRRDKAVAFIALIKDAAREFD